MTYDVAVRRGGLTMTQQQLSNHLNVVRRNVIRCDFCECLSHAGEVLLLLLAGEVRLALNTE